LSGEPGYVKGVWVGVKLDRAQMALGPTLPGALAGGIPKFLALYTH